MKKRRAVDAGKLIGLLDMKNSVDYSGDINLSLQIAIQSKLIQTAKKKAGIFTGKLGYFDALGDGVPVKKFIECSIPRSLSGFEDSVDNVRLDYFQFWAASGPDDVYYSGLLPDDILDDLFFIVDSWLLEMDGTCTTVSPALEEMVKDTLEEFRLYEDEEESERVERISYLIRQMDFYFSGKIGPMVWEVSEYIDSLYCFSNMILPREEIAKHHDLFSLIYEYGSECLVSIVSSKDTAEYYKYRDRIPDSDIRKQIADKAVNIFLHPISSDKENVLFGSWDTVIEKPDRHIVICFYGENEYSDFDTASAITNPFYVEALQIVETLLPVLEEEYTGKNNRQAV